MTHTAMKVYRYVLIAFFLVCLTSCSITRNRMYVPDSTRLNLTMADLEYVGETEISVDYRTYLGFISVIDRLNGVPYDGAEIKTVNVSDRESSALKLYGKLKRASYKLLDEFPDGEYFIVTSQSKSVTRWFLGSSISVKARVKVYSLK